MVLLTLFAALALILASAGIYAVNFVPGIALELGRAYLAFRPVWRQVIRNAQLSRLSFQVPE